MIQNKIRYPDLLVVELYEINIESIFKVLNLPVNVLHTTQEKFYRDFISAYRPIVISEAQKFSDLINLLSEPEKFTSEYRGYLILIIKDTTIAQKIFNILQDAEIILIPYLNDLKSFNRTLKVILEKVYFYFSKNALEDEIFRLNNFIADLNVENRRQLLEVEKYISDLEMKSLEIEIVNKRLEKEIHTREAYEKEMHRLNSLLQDYAFKLNDLVKELKTFNYTISHDLKAPLRGIINYLRELFKEHLTNIQLSDRANFCLDQIQKSAINLSKMIDDLLQYSKLEFETPGFIECNLEEIINSSLNELSSLIQGKDFEIKFNLEVKKVWSWQRGLLQVFSNLISNAIKYSKSTEKLRIEISSLQVDNDVLIIVKDNGIGFDMIYADRIFKLFNRAAQDSTIEGTGVGLAIVSKIVEKMKGKVWAESEIGVGSKFYIQFPLRELRDYGG